jgi:hypothetical protein
MFSPHRMPPTATPQTTSPTSGADEVMGGGTLPINIPETEDLSTWEGPRAAMRRGNNTCDKLLLMEKENINDLMGLEYLADRVDGDWDKMAEVASYSFDSFDGDNFHSIEQVIYSTMQKKEETLESFNARLDAWFSKLQARNLQEGIRLLDARSLAAHETQYRYMASKVLPNHHAETNEEGACYTVDFYVMDEGEMRELFYAEQEQGAAFMTDVGKQPGNSSSVKDDGDLTFKAYKVARDRFVGRTGVRGSRGKGHSKMKLAERKGTTTCRRCNQMGHWEAECLNKAKPNPVAATGANAPAVPCQTPSSGGGPASSGGPGPRTTWDMSNGLRSAHVPYSD